MCETGTGQQVAQLLDSYMIMATYIIKFLINSSLADTKYITVLCARTPSIHLPSFFRVTDQVQE
jgi:hypothetical protein